MKIEGHFLRLQEKFAAVRQEGSNKFPHIEAAHHQLDLLSQLGAHVRHMRKLLLELRAMRAEHESPEVPPWLRSDAFIEMLRHCGHIFADVIERAGNGHPETAKQTAELRKTLASGSPGQALVKSCEVVVWYLGLLVHVQAFMVAAFEADGLKSENVEDHIDETARSRFKEARRDKTLARLRLICNDQLDHDERTLDAERKDVERRRHRIDVQIAPYDEPIRAFLIAQLRAALDDPSLTPKNATALRQMIKGFENLEDPLARRFVKTVITFLRAMAAMK